MGNPSLRSLPVPNIEHHESALRHAWGWVSVHTSHRLQSIYFFLIAASFLTHGYVSAMTAGHNKLGAGIATLGLCFTAALAGMEQRSRHYLELGERAMLRAEIVLSNETETDAFNILRELDTRPSHTLQKWISPVLFGCAGAGFLGALVAAMVS